MLEKLLIITKYTRLEKNNAGIKANHSDVSTGLMVAFLTQEVTTDNNRQLSDVVPSGMPITVSFIIPAKNIFPNPKSSRKL